MARGPRKVKPAGPLDAVHARIREAEKKTAPLARESVGLDAEGYEHLALCIERGLGRKPEVLRQALATGLRVMVRGTAEEAPPPFSNTNGIEIDERPRAEINLEEAALRALGGGKDVPIGPPIVTLPSQQRRIEAGEELEEEPEEEEA